MSRFTKTCHCITIVCCSISLVLFAMAAINFYRAYRIAKEQAEFVERMEKARREQ